MLRSAGYVGGAGLTSPLWIIVAWILAGTALTVLAASSLFVYVLHWQVLQELRHTPWLAAAAGLAGAGLLAGQPARILAMVIGAAALWGLYWLLRRGSSGALGAGDVRLAGLLGTVLGFDSLWLLLWATAAAFVLGGLAALVVVVRDRGDLQTRIPFGPAMIAGAAAALVVV